MGRTGSKKQTKKLKRLQKKIKSNKEQYVTTDFFIRHIMAVFELITCKEMNCSKESIREKDSHFPSLERAAVKVNRRNSDYCELFLE